MLCALALGFAVSVAASGSPAPELPSGPVVKVDVSVSPTAVAPGGETEVTVKVAPRPGIKLNRYPRIRVAVPEVAGLVAAAEGSVGNDAPPPPEKLEGNYFRSVEPVRLKLRIDGSATKGRHGIEAKLSYAYCVAASGFCSPAKETLRIPVTIR